MSNFARALKSIGNETLTENGAVSYKSTLNSVLDFFYNSPAQRGQTDKVVSEFNKALQEDVVLTTKALFYLRDIRGGQGERDLFRACLNALLVSKKNNIFEKIVHLVPEYGRWDDLLWYFDVPCVVELVRNQLRNDIKSNGNVSLLAKWLPSINTSSQKTVTLAKEWCRALGLDEKSYRKMLSSLRRKINLVETQMSEHEWDMVDYSKVPSKAGLKYRKAFSRHDAERYTAFIQDAKEGKTKINASTVYPYELVHTVRQSVYEFGTDYTAEAQWKQLPNYADTDQNALVVVDVSGSMETQLDKSKATCMDVSIGLGIYIAQRNTGPMHNLLMTFTDKPSIYELKDNESLAESISKVRSRVGYDTNVEAVFRSILKYAKKHNLTDDDMPKKIYIVSDMEFNHIGGFTAFEAAKAMFEGSGYTLPTLIFWNVESRGAHSPVEFDERGVYLVSGCSPTIFKHTINTKATNPMEMMLDVLNSERYQAVEKALD